MKELFFSACNLFPPPSGRKSGCILLIQQTLVWRLLSWPYGDDEGPEGGDKLPQSRHCLERVVNRKSRAKGFWKEATAKFLESRGSIYYLYYSSPSHSCGQLILPGIVGSLGNPDSLCKSVFLAQVLTAFLLLQLNCVHLRTVMLYSGGYNFAFRSLPLVTLTLH